MALIGKITVGLSANIGAFRRDMRAASGVLRGWKRSVSGSLASINKGFGRARRFGFALAAGLGTAAYAAHDFERAMLNVQTLVDTSQYSMKDLSNGVLNLSDRVGIAATDISGSMYQMISATGDTAKSLNILDMASKAAVVGVGSITQSIELGTGILNAYSMDMSQFGRVMDMAVKTVKIGKTTIGEMGEEFGKMIPFAAQLKIPLEDVFAATATLTKGSMKTNIAITALRGIMAGIISPTAEAAATAERLEIKFNVAAIQAMGLTKWLAHVQEKTKGNTEELGKLFGNMRGLIGVLGLGGKRAKEFANITDEVRDSVGSVQTKFAEISKTEAFQFQKNLNELKNTFIRLGIKVIPVINSIVKSIRKWYEENPRLAKTLAYVLGGLVAVHMSGIIPLVSGIGGLILKLPALIAGLKAVGVASTGILSGLGTTAGAIGLIAAKIAAVVAAAYGLYKLSEWISKKTGFADLAGRALHWSAQGLGLADEEMDQAGANEGLRSIWKRQMEEGRITRQEYERRIEMNAPVMERLLGEIKEELKRPKPAIAG